jgi:hypothetical protein
MQDFERRINLALRSLVARTRERRISGSGGGLPGDTEWWVRASIEGTRIRFEFTDYQANLDGPGLSKMFEESRGYESPDGFQDDFIVNLLAAVVDDRELQALDARIRARDEKPGPTADAPWWKRSWLWFKG